MHDPKISTMTAHAQQQQDPSGHAPFVRSDIVAMTAEGRVALECLTSGSPYLHRQHRLSHPVPIPLHHYIPFPLHRHHHHHHHFFSPGGTPGVSSMSERVPPLSPPVADAVPSTLPLATPVSSYPLASSALKAPRDLSLHGVYGNDHIASSILLQQHSSRMPAHLRVTDHERIFSFMPNTTAAAIDSGGELAGWPPLVDLDIAAAAARYYRSLGTPYHRVDLAQKTSPGQGLFSPLLARSHLVHAGYLGRQGGARITDLPNSLPQPVTASRGNPELKALKPPYTRLVPSTLALSIPSTLSSPVSSSPTTPTSSLSQRAGALTLAASPSSCVTTKPTMTTTTKPSSPSLSYSSSVPTAFPLEPSPPVSQLSQRDRGARESNSPGPSQQSSPSRCDELDPNHERTHEPDIYEARRNRFFIPDHQRRCPDSPLHDPYSVDASPGARLSRKHLWSQADLEPLCDSAKRPALVCSLSMPAASPPLSPSSEFRHGASPAPRVHDGHSPRFIGVRDSPSPTDRNPAAERSRFEPLYTEVQCTPAHALNLNATRDSSPSPSQSPVTATRHVSLHEHLLLSKAGRFDPWPINGSIVSGIPPARYSSRCTLYRYDSYNGNSSNGRVSPPPVQGRDSRASPGKELPTRTLKQERARDRQDVTSALDADREHAERLSNIKKCASTQTQFSSFMGESTAPPPPPPYYTTHDTIPHDSILNGQHHALHSGRSSYPHPPPPLHSYYPHSLAHLGTSGTPPTATEQPPPPSHSSRGMSASSLSTTATSPLASSYLPPPPPSHQPAPSYSDSYHSRHPHASPSPPAGTTPTLPPAPPLVHAPMRSTPPPPLPPYPGPPLPPPHYHAELSRGGADVQHAPLNLSLSHTAAPPQFQPISNGRRSPTYQRLAKATPSHQQRPSSLENGFGSPMSQEDESIEEHFRRSLGKSYPEPPALTPAPPPAPPVSPPVTLTLQKPGNPEIFSLGKVACQPSGEKICSVDDHFARALGDQMWTEIKARTEVASLDGLTDTVDAHFAKALGANMWKKLKEESKGAEEMPTTPKSKQQQSKPSLALVVHNSSKTSSTSHSPAHAPLVT